jgi:hypothetical protein
MRMCNYNYIHPGFIFIPFSNTTPGALRAQYLIPNLTPKCECLSIHLSLPLGPRRHAIPRNQRKQSLCRTEAKLPTASISVESSEEIFLRWTGFFTKLGPQIRLSPVPIFGINNCVAYGPPVDGTLESARDDDRTANHYTASLEAAPVRVQDTP